SAGSLHGLDVERRVFGLAGLRIPDAVIFALEQALELTDAGEAILFLAHAVAAAEVVRERHELRAIAEMTEATAIAIRRRDCGSPERAAVIAALEREHQALAVAGVAHELQGIFDGL